MSVLAISQRYAKGLLMYAVEFNKTEEVLVDVNKLEEVAKNIPEFLSNLDKEDIPVANRLKLTEEVCRSLNINEAVTTLLKILIERGRIVLFPYVAIVYRELVDEIKKNHRALVKVADPSFKEEAIKITTDVLKEIVGGNVFCECSVDKSLIGGVVIQIGDTICDMSTSKQIDDLVETLDWRLNGNQA